MFTHQTLQKVLMIHILLYLFIAEYLKTSYAHFSHRINTISTYPVQEGKETSVVTEDSMTNSEFTTVYILVGIGPIVSLFLFATLMQLCKKYKKARRQLRTADDNKEPGHTSSNISSTDQSLKLSETGYEEINDISESQQLESLNASDAYEIPRTSGRDTTLSHGNIPTCSSENGVFVEHNVVKMSNDENNYLTPLSPNTLFTTENETFENEKLYIDVIV